MTSTVVNLYKCTECGRQRYSCDIMIGNFCKCGSNRTKYLQYTPFRFIKALIYDKSIRQLYWEENIKKGKFNVYSK